MGDVVSQVWVTVFGLTALLCMQTHRVRVRRMGVVLGLIGQPAWYIQLVIHEQWGMLPVFVGYTGVWLFGAWNLWISPWLGPLIDPLGEAPSVPPEADLRHASRTTSPVGTGEEKGVRDGD